MGRGEWCVWRAASRGLELREPGCEFGICDAAVSCSSTLGRRRGANKRFHARHEGADLGRAGDVADLGEAYEALEDVGVVEGGDAVFHRGLAAAVGVGEDAACVAVARERDVGCRLADAER